MKYIRSKLLAKINKIAFHSQADHPRFWLFTVVTLTLIYELKVSVTKMYVLLE